MLRKRQAPIWVVLGMVFLAGFFASTNCLAQPAPTLAEENPTSKEELLNLPAFEADPQTEPDLPVTLELLPEAEKTASEPSVAAPSVEPAPPPAVPTPIPTEQATPAAAETITDTTVAEPTPPPAPTAAPEAVAASPTIPEPVEPEAPAVASTAEPAPTLAQNMEEKWEDFIGPHIPIGPMLPADSAPTVATNTPAEPTEVVTTLGEDLLKDGWDDGSIMFSDREIRQLQETLLALRSGEEAPVLQADSGVLPVSDEKKALPPEYASFYVNSIMYFGKDHWLVWVNGKKFFPGKDSPLERVTIDTVDSKKVTLLWKPVTRAQIPEKIDPETITVEPSGTVKLTMAANQTFVVPLMKLVEGRGMSPEVRELLALNVVSTNQKTDAGANNSAMPADRDAMNVDKLVSQYRNASEALPLASPQSQTTGAAP